MDHWKTQARAEEHLERKEVDLDKRGKMMERVIPGCKTKYVMLEDPLTSWTRSSYKGTTLRTSPLHHLNPLIFHLPLQLCLVPCTSQALNGPIFPAKREIRCGDDPRLRQPIRALKGVGPGPGSTSDGGQPRALTGRGTTLQCQLLALVQLTSHSSAPAAQSTCQEARQPQRGVRGDLALLISY